MRGLGATVSVAAVVVLALAGGLAAAGVAEPSAASFTFDRFNGTYENVVRDIAPVHQGPMTVRPSSPSHTLTLEDHRLELSRLGRGEHRARFWMRFAGQAKVVADLELAGVPGRLEDDVTIPAQERSVEARIRMVRGDEGFLITTLEMPAELEVEVRSDLGGQLVSWCEKLTFFMPGAACSGLDHAVSHPRLPLPKPGAEFVLKDSDLTPAEVERLRAYLSR